MDRPAGGVADGARGAGRVRGQAERSVRLAAAVRAVPRAVRRLAAAAPDAAPRPARAARFGVSHIFFNRGEISTSVPLVYPVLLYVLGRMLWIGFRGARAGARARAARARSPGSRSAVIFLVGFRIALNVADSSVIDVGYAGSIGADKIVHGHGLYDKPASPRTTSTATPTGRPTTSPTSRSWLALGFDGTWGDLPSAHAAAIASTCSRCSGCSCSGGGCGGAAGWRSGSRSRTRGRRSRTRCSRSNWNSNDSLVAMLRVGAGGAALGAAARPAARAGRGGEVRPACARAAVRVLRRASGTAGAARSCLGGDRARGVACFAPFIPATGACARLRPHARLPGRRGSPFSIWGQYASLTAALDRGEGRRSGSRCCVAFVPRGPRRRCRWPRSARRCWSRSSCRVALVLPVRRVVHAVRAGGAVRAPLATSEQEPAASVPARRGPSRRSHEGAVLVAALTGSWALTLWVMPWSDERRQRPVRLPLLRAPVARRAAALPRRRFEYPPLAAPAIGLPGLAGTGAEAYRWTFALFMLAWAGRRAAARARARRGGRAATSARQPRVAAAPAPHGRDDAHALRPARRWRSCSALAAAPCASGPSPGSALLGVATMTKGFPIVILPVGAGVARRARGAAGALRGACAFAAVVALLARRVRGRCRRPERLDAVRYQTERPVQIESLPALGLRAIDGAGGAARRAQRPSYKSDGLEHPAADTSSRLGRLARRWRCSLRVPARRAARQTSAGSRS